MKKIIEYFSIAINGYLMLFANEEIRIIAGWINIGVFAVMTFFFVLVGIISFLEETNA